jgi:transposase InsO family protein
VQAQSDRVPVLNHQLRRWENIYNCVRPHQSLAYLTPLEFITRWKANLRKAKCHESTGRVHVLFETALLCVN